MNHKQLHGVTIRESFDKYPAYKDLFVLRQLRNEDNNLEPKA